MSHRMDCMDSYVTLATGVVFIAFNIVQIFQTFRIQEHFSFHFFDAEGWNTDNGKNLVKNSCGRGKIIMEQQRIGAAKIKYRILCKQNLFKHIKKGKGQAKIQCSDFRE